MISGDAAERRRHARRRVLAVAVAGTIGSAAWRPAFALEPARWAEMVSRAQSRQARFVERRHSSMLTEPITRAGVLRFTADGVLEREVERPAYERMRIDGQRLTIETRAGSREVELALHAALATFATTLRAVLSGDLAALARLHRIELAGSDASWTMKLRPLDAMAAGPVAGMRVSGGYGDVTWIEFDETSGDRIEISIVPQPR